MYRRDRRPRARVRHIASRAKVVRFLIVCEGTRTEPNYFRSLVEHISSDVIEVDCQGEGRGTSSLVRQASKLKREKERERQLRYDRVWVVFDKDDFADFDAAIAEAEALGYHCAWSNESFELWYCLHFGLVDSMLTRRDYINFLNEAFRSHIRKKHVRYRKNSRDILRILNQYGDSTQARAYAESLLASYGMDTPRSLCRPCTTVHRLVDELEHPDRILLEQLLEGQI